ncbi:MAG: rod shape-determining protein MreC [Blastocatellia bacterium]|nr:rod shape-determining protein MreC [Blastocatellia bacterium]
MSSAETTKNRAPLVLVILLVGQLLLVSSQARSRGGENSMLRGWVVTVASLLQRVTGVFGDRVYGVWRGYVDLRGARQESTQLRSENDQMRQEIVRLKEELSSYQREDSLKKVQEVLPYKSITAKVIARDGSLWFNRITINKGSLAGVQLDQPVMTPGGVVGRVIKIGPLASQVQLITDRYAGIGGQLSNSRAYGEVKGNGKSECDMRNVSGLEKVEEGELIITSGLDGIYPKGLLIGYVEHIGLGGGARNHQITVRPSAGLEKLEDVLVLELKAEDLEMNESIK